MPEVKTMRLPCPVEGCPGVAIREDGQPSGCACTGKTHGCPWMPGSSSGLRLPEIAADADEDMCVWVEALDGVTDDPEVAVPTPSTSSTTTTATN
jgi:hypothetical protein